MASPTALPAGPSEETAAVAAGTPAPDEAPGVALETDPGTADAAAAPSSPEPAPPPTPPPPSDASLPSDPTIVVDDDAGWDARAPESKKDREARAEAERDAHLDEVTFPDGGLAWLSVFCMFMVHFWVVGISTNVGIFTDYFTAEATFPGAANTVLSFASTLTTTGMDLYGPLTGFLAERFSYRLVACTGAILLASGGIINSFAVQVWTLFVGGIVTGFGYSALLAPALAIPTHWFRKRLSLAFGIGMSGAGIGGAVIIPLTQYLLDVYDWRWAYRIIAIVSGGVCFITGFLMIQRLPKRPRKDPVMDATLFRNPTYWKLSAMTFFYPPCFLAPFLFVPQQIQDLGSGNTISAALCLSLLNLFMAVGQVLSGFTMKAMGQYNMLVYSVFATLLLFVPLWILTVGTSGAGILAFCILLGIISGPFPVTVTDVAADRFGQHQFATKITWVFIWFAPGILITGPILGAIADANSIFAPDGARLSTNWTWVIAYCGFTQAIVVAMAVWLRVERGGWNPFTRL